MEKLEKALVGILLGTAAGDSMGLPYEGLTARRQEKMFPLLKGQRFLCGRGMISDDTEHTCMVARALLHSGGEKKAFLSSLAWMLRIWLLMLPAGIGAATLKALLRLWAGISPERSGVFSAGNGPSMRTALLGVLYGDEPEKLRELVKAATRLTHSDPKAEYGAQAIALAAWMTSRTDDNLMAGDVERTLREYLPAEAGEFLFLIHGVIESLSRGESTAAYAASNGLVKGITGYTYHTVPAVLHCWLRHQDDFEGALIEIIRCGGDTDTTAAILGAIVGAHVGEEGIPRSWLDRILDWPCSLTYLKKLARELFLMSQGKEDAPASQVPFPASPVRNFFFMLLVLLHGFRRLLPPY
jgi:ADP-ribosyl-[dinitrogen reductase] hydrolase